MKWLWKRRKSQREMHENVEARLDGHENRLDEMQRRVDLLAAEVGLYVKPASVTQLREVNGS